MNISCSVIFPADQCKNFNDWFGSTKMSLKECFESSETKKNVEQKLQKLSVRHINFNQNLLKL